MNDRSFHRAIPGIGRKPFSWYILWIFQILNTLWSTLCLWSPTSSPVLLHFISFSLMEGCLSASSHSTGLRGVMQGPGVFGSGSEGREKAGSFRMEMIRSCRPPMSACWPAGVFLLLRSHQENSEHRRNGKREWGQETLQGKIKLKWKWRGKKRSMKMVRPISGVAGDEGFTSGYQVKINGPFL